MYADRGNWLRATGLVVGLTLAGALSVVGTLTGAAGDATIDVSDLRPENEAAATRGGWANLPVDARTAISAVLSSEGVDLVEQAKLTASDGGADESFGSAVAIDGDTIVVGVPGDIVGTNWSQGSAYVFTRPAGGWSSGTEIAKLTASDGGHSDYFGQSVAIHGDTIVIGAPYDRIGASGWQGSAYVFARPGSGWASGTETVKLHASDGSSYAQFGASVAIDGDTIVVGALGDSIDGGWYQGSAYVFTLTTGSGSNWTQAAKLVASDGRPSDQFGASVAIAGDAIVAGSPGHAVGAASSQGAAYVFTRPESGWADGVESAKLTTSDGGGYDQFGASVAIDDDTIVGGARSDTIGGYVYQGSAYVFTRPAGGWSSGTETAKLTASDGTSYQAFGARLDVDGETIVVGVRDNKVGLNWAQGSAYIFTRPAGGWANGDETAKLIASDGSSYDYFGAGIAVQDSTVVVGAFGDDVGSSSNQGSAYVFEEPNLLPEGTHDAVEGLASDWACGAAGWAVDPDDRYADLPVRILVDEEVVAETIADQFRPDLLEPRVSPDGFSAYELNLWDLAPMEGGHQVRVQAQDAQTFDWVDLNLTPKSLGCHLRVASQLAELLDAVSSSSLRDKLRTVLRHYEAGRYGQAVDNLEAFINQVTVPSSRESAATTLGYLGAAEQIETWIKADAGMVAGGVTGWWPADGSPSDLAGGRTATLVGDVGYVAGIDRQAFHLDGDGDFVAIPDAPGIDLGGGDFTVSLWVKFDTLSGEQVLAEKYIEQFDGSLSTGWTLTKVEGNEIVLALGAGGGGFASVPQKLKPGVWHQFAARRSGNEFTVFRDGEVIAAGMASETFTGDLTTVAQLKFGHRGNPDDTPGSLDDSNYWLHGAIDEAQIVVGRALSDGEVRAIYEASRLGEPIVDRGRVVVTVETDPDDSRQTFDFVPSWSSDGFSVVDGQYHESGPLAPGTYSVSETVPYGWELAGATCSDGSPVDAIVVTAGEVVTCTFNNRAGGRIHVVKETTPDGSSEQFAFDADWGAFSLSDGELRDSGYLTPGTYAVSEVVPEGWVLHSATCSDGSPVEAIDVGPGEVVTCTFRNRALGKIIVEKQTTPDGSSQEFEFFPSWGSGFVLHDGEVNDSGYLDPGTYSVVEAVPDGWTLTSVACSDGSPNGSISVSAGEVVTCTFNNGADGRIVVVKETDPADAPEFFSFGASWYPWWFSLQDGGQHDSGPLPPGTYNVTELSYWTIGWELMSATCSDGSPTSAIALDPGEVVTCTFTNRTYSRLTIWKQTDPQGSAQAFQFTADWGSFGLVDDTYYSLFLHPGTYSVAEAAIPGWNLSTAMCSDGSPVSAIALSPRENVTCTFVNVQAVPPPVTPPVTPPITPPVTPPICPPVTPPVTPPLTPPISGPISPPISPPISGPISPPMSAAVIARSAAWVASAACRPAPTGLASFLASAQAGLVGSVFAVILSLSMLAGLGPPIADRVRRRIRWW